MNNPIGARLLPMCMVACVHMQPFINRIYQLGGALFQTKEDSSAVTLADTLIQSLLRKLLTPFVEDCIGEESTEYDWEHSKLDDAELQKLVDQAYKDIDTLIDMNKTYTEIRSHNLLAIVDPVDGTREFTIKRGNESTICIGFAKKEYHSGKYVPYAGLIFRPIYKDPTATVRGPPEYAMGCVAEGFKYDTLSRYSDGHDKFVTSSSTLSPFLQQILTHDYKHVRIGGCGNKTLLLLEGRGDIYLQDRGVSRWDTCAAQAILEAYDGGLWKLTNFLQSNTYTTYEYRVSDVNMDPNPSARFGKMNMTTIEPDVLGTPIGDKNELVKPYSNLCGLLALPYSMVGNAQRMKRLVDTLKMLTEPPAYD